MKGSWERRLGCCLCGMDGVCLAISKAQVGSRSGGRDGNGSSGDGWRIVGEWGMEKGDKGGEATRSKASWDEL